MKLPRDLSGSEVATHHNLDIDAVLKRLNLL
jgi:hypothetical protein